MAPEVIVLIPLKIECFIVTFELDLSFIAGADIDEISITIN